MSWYKGTELTNKQLKYLKLLQEIWKVKDANREWIPYRLTAHEIEYHSKDITIMGEDAKSSVVVKSRNTSFTVSTLIRLMMAVPSYPDQIQPFVRLNTTRAIDLINEAKELMLHMTPIRLENGSLYPFDPAEVNTDRAGSIKFPNKVEFRAMPASAQSAETIRGMRIRGPAGIVDEANFCSDFKKIYIALRDASAGSVGSKKHFQMNIGTTRKGMMTDFNIWFEGVEVKELKNIEILKWPVFDPSIFDIDKSILEQPGLIPIVHWHVLEDLEDKRVEDKKIFLEEYMAILTSDDQSYYPIEIILPVMDSNLINYETPPEDLYGDIYMGVDPAGGEGENDYFAISVFELLGDEYYQRKVYYSRNTGLDGMSDYTSKLIELWKPTKCRVDANLIGFQLGQSLVKKHGKSIIEAIRGRVTIKVTEEFNVPVKEFMHVNQKKLINQQKVHYISDEVQIHHFTGWDYKFECPRTKEYGHGDTTISNALALLPPKKARVPMVSTLRKGNSEEPEVTPSEIMGSIIKNQQTETWGSKLQRLKSNRR